MHVFTSPYPLLQGLLRKSKICISKRIKIKYGKACLVIATISCQIAPLNKNLPLQQTIPQQVPLKSTHKIPLQHAQNLNSCGVWWTRWVVTGPSSTLFKSKCYGFIVRAIMSALCILNLVEVVNLGFSADLLEIAQQVSCFIYCKKNRV